MEDTDPVYWTGFLNEKFERLGSPLDKIVLFSVPKCYVVIECGDVIRELGNRCYAGLLYWTGFLKASYQTYGDFMKQICNIITGDRINLRTLPSNLIHHTVNVSITMSIFRSSFNKVFLFALLCETLWSLMSIPSQKNWTYAIECESNLLSVLKS